QGHESSLLFHAGPDTVVGITGVRERTAANLSCGTNSSAAPNGALAGSASKMQNDAYAHDAEFERRTARSGASLVGNRREDRLAPRRSGGADRSRQRAAPGGARRDRAAAAADPPPPPGHAGVILVDTSVWVDHLRRGNDDLRRLLNGDEVLTHAAVIGEL